MELLIPRSLSVYRDTLRLVDAGSDKVVVFDTAGVFARNLTGLPNVTVAVVAFDSTGAGIVARHGLDSSLARRFSPDGSLGAKVGSARVPPSYNFDFAQIKLDIAAARAPENLRNHSLALLGASGDAWVVLLIDGVIQHYSPSDSLEWERTLPDSTIQRIRQAMAEVGKKDTVPGRFAFPTMVSSARVINDELWLLLKEPGEAPASVAIVDRTGGWQPRLEIDGASHISAFDFDPGSRTLLLLDGSEGTLLRAKIP
jgi:hypothetical protein